MSPDGGMLETARALAPTIAKFADRVEAERRLPKPLADALHDAGLFRMLLPRSLGGAELDPPTFVQVMETVAMADASTAWVLGQTAGCSMIAAYLEPTVAKKIFGPPRGVLAWGSGPQGSAVRVDGGYRLTGAWSYASGIREATWVGAHTFVMNADGSSAHHADGAPVIRTLVFPIEQARISDVWDVMGLRGTGSDTYEVTDLFVPDPHSAARDDAAERREQGPLYCFSSGNLYASGFACVSLGIARALLDAYLELAGTKTAHRAKRPLRESPVVQTQVALADARLRAARSHLLETLRDIQDLARHAGEITLAQRVRIRQAASFASREGREVGTQVFHAAGAQAIFASGPWERRLRDLHTVSQQLQGRDDHFEAVGRFLLGLAPDSPFI
ncbi:MAG TPA: acyl-CoA dehydrogenase family protein [Methylomirabilota bacterium]|nr:acyl-CoA dehydrogenase family protein [Methylomirabilota bacterium]